MTELARIRWRTLGWFVLFPVTLLGVVPWWLHARLEGPFVWEGAGWQWLGAWLIVNGVGLGGWCVNLFNVEGRGTPMPFDPPRRFVASGPYRMVRNPMMLSVFLVLGGEAALYHSAAISCYALALIAIAHTFVCVWEEPALERRFGDAYAVYKRQVPRWFPRLPARSGRQGPRPISDAPHAQDAVQ